MSRPNERPDWASGPEWEGWQEWPRGVYRSCPQLSFVIYAIGGMAIHDEQSEIEITTDSPQAALAAANALAEACGGWE